MRLLVDECVDWRLVRDLHTYETRTVKQAGWEELDDGELLRRAAREFDAFITVDKDLPKEQNLAKFNIAVIILRGRTTRLADLRALLPALHEALAKARKAELQVLNWRDPNR
jgi:predicted nuclease of predicted toxin-antitoxin system